MKYLIFGSRDYRKGHLVIDFLSKHLKSGDTVISGLADGADNIAKSTVKLMKKLGFDVELIEMPANWEAYGKKAGMVRNKEMVVLLDDNDIAVGFWNESSNGSKNTIELCENKKLLVYGNNGKLLMRNFV